MARLLKECKTCIYLDNNTCRWFKKPKEIPKDVTGCKLHIDADLHPLSREIIQLFNGRVIK